LIWQKHTWKGVFLLLKRGAGIGKTKRGKGSKIITIADVNGLPNSISSHEENTHEMKLIDETISGRLFNGRLKQIIADRAYDSDRTNKELRKKQIKSN